MPSRQSAKTIEALAYQHASRLLCRGGWQLCDSHIAPAAVGLTAKRHTSKGNSGEYCELEAGPDCVKPLTGVSIAS